MKITTFIVKSLFEQIMKYPIIKYYSFPHTIQSSVGLIFRIPSIKEIENKQNLNNILSYQKYQIQDTQLLFVQRAGYQSDRNAYNIVFPGGQCDSQQTDLQACQRQLTQQIGISTQKQCIHIGQFPKNFYYLKKRGKQVHISCHVYILKSSQNQWKPTLNSEQLIEYKWVKISDILKKENYKKSSQIKLGVFERMPAFASKIAKNNIQKVIMPELDLGMNRNLWGLSLWIWSYSLQMAINQKSGLIQNQKKQQLKQIINQMKSFELQFKSYSLLRYPATFLAFGWHYLNRVKPFTYKNSKYQKKSLLKNILIVISILVLINFFTILF